MKKSLSKKITAMFLAVLMLVSSVPFVASAADKNQTTISNAETAISSYEKAMRDGVIFSEMKATYEQYLKTKKLCDSYKYGKLDDAQTNNLASNLSTETTKLNNMVENGSRWTATSINYQAVKWAADGYNTNELSAQNSKYVLWADTFDWLKNVQVLDNAIGNRSEQDIYTCYQDVVLCYEAPTDNVNEMPRFPVMCAVAGKSSDAKAVYISNANSDFRIYKPSTPGGSVISNWPEWTGEVADQWAGGYDNMQSSKSSYYGYNLGDGAKMILSGNRSGWTFNAHGNCFDKVGSAWKAYSSTIQLYNGANIFNDSNPYSISKKLSFGMFANVDYKGGSITHWDPYWEDRYLDGSTEHPYATHVINYYAVKQAINGAKSTIQNYFNSPLSYLESSSKMAEFMGYIDNATKFSPSDSKYNYASNTANTVATVGSDIKTIVNNLSTSVNAVGDKYTGLVASMQSAEALLADDNSNYTTASLSNLESKLTAAYNHFNDVNNLYVNATAESLNNALASAMVVDTPNDAPTGLDSKASFAGYDSAKASLIADLQNPEYKFTYDSLDALNTTVNSATYFSYDDAAKNNVSHTKQGAVDTEAGKLTVASLTAADSSAYDAIKAQAEAIIAGANNADKYNLAVLKNAIAFPVSKPITVAGVACTGYDYESVTTLIQTAINESQYSYTVKVVDVNGNAKYLLEDGNYTTDAAQAFGFHYGDKVTATNTEVCDWAITVKAAASQQNMKSMYVYTGDSYEFFVGGDTVLETFSSTGAPEGTYKVSLIDSRIDEATAFDYTENGVLNLASLNVPTIAFHKVESFTVNGTEYDVSDVVTGITGDIEVVINYVPVAEQGKYNITILNLESDDVKISYEKKYNDRVVVNVKNAVGYINNANGSCLWNAPNYVFYANEDITIKPVTTEETDINNMVNAISKPVMNNGQPWFVGQFANLPDGCTVKKFGFVIDRYNKFADTDFTLAMIDREAGIYQFDCKVYDEANMFVFILSSKFDGAFGFNSYIVYEQDGVEKIAYSKTYHNVVVD